MHALLRTLLVFFAVMLLQACGGGGGSASNSGGTSTAVSAIPSGISAVAGDTKVALSWNASAGATSYSVKRATTSGGPYTLAGSPTSNAFMDTGRTNGTVYYYVVSAINSGGESANSTEVAATPVAIPAPAAPTGLAAISADSKVTLSWNATASATSYTVRRSTKTGGPYTTIGTPTGSPFVDTGCANGSTCYYVITAVNAGGESASSAEVAATPSATPPVQTAPAAPTGLFTVGSDTQIVLSWSPSVAASSYKVKRAATLAGPFTQVGTVANAPYTDTGRVNGTTYYYVVSALNAVGESADSAAVSGTAVGVVVPVVTAPAVPTGLAAVATDGQIALTWNPSATATSYKLYRGNAASGPFTQIVQLAGTAYSDTGRTSGTTYHYKVSAINTGGESTMSGVVSATTPQALPAAPTGLSATPGDAQVVLSWNPSPTATGYKLKRATVSGGPYTVITTQAGTSYTDTGRTNGTTYYYVVSATSGVGEGTNAAEVYAKPVAAGPVVNLPALPADDPTKNYIGMNVWFLSDWDNSFAFVDAMKQARPWQDGANWNNPVAGVDAYGWPTADASTVIFTGSPAQVNGTYKLIFNGKATVSLMWTGGSVANQNYNAATNTTTADVTFNLSAGGSVGLIFRNTQRTASSATNTGFTNARLYKPGYATDGSAVYTTAFLNALGKASAVRMMDWTATNANMTQRWADRITPLHMSKTNVTYTGPGGTVWNSSAAGVALEHQIQLCNALHADCWINIPVVADDTYIRNMALALRYGTDGTNPYTSVQANPKYPPLDPNVHLYLEYANEIWNSAGGFQCFPAIQDIVSSLPANHPLLTPAESSIWFKMWRYPAYRLVTISDTFRSVYGDASMMNRVRPVLMAQQGDGQMSLQMALNWLDAYGRTLNPVRTVNSYLYGAGGSAYYGVNGPPANTADRDAFFAAGNYPATQNVRGIGIDSVYATNFGLKRIAYEGGPSLDNYPDANARAINADARMQDMVVKTHDAWSNQAGDLLMYYALVGPSSWEFTPDITTTNTPKLNAITQLRSQARAAVTLGQALPGTIVATDQATYRVRIGYDYNTSCDTLPCLGGNDPGEWVALPGHASTAFTGNIVVNGLAYTPTVANVWVNGVKAGQVTIAGTNHLVNSSSLSAPIPAGLVVIRLEIVSGGLNLRSISVN